jgi:hypothetical protein
MVLVIPTKKVGCGTAKNWKLLLPVALMSWALQGSKRPIAEAQHTPPTAFRASLRLKEMRWTFWTRIWHVHKILFACLGMGRHLALCNLYSG